ncbi:MAG TPA: DUF2911 domain-containing protein [Thermoanaerobaculia bacterium]|nr:DUF2911 domain-containing protein [Thermoanaerobaculia bacterium]HQR66385.1 DUF2911 domain-containing protein [Thermoanaerobaculia bacterium]
MKKPMFLALVAAALAAAAPLAAQFEAPMPSPKATVTQRIGATDFSVSYSRPGVKGRVIWGGLVPYDKPWRTGANRATTIASSDEFEVEGKKLPAGTYSIVTIPGKESWTVAFNRDLDLWFKTDYDEKKDALRVTVKPETLPEAVESFTIVFRNVTNDGADLSFIWEKLRVPVKIKVDTKALVLAKGRAAVAGAKADDWETPLAVGRYLWNEKLGDPGEAMKDVQKSIAAKKGYSNTGQLARMLAAEGRTAEAIKAGEEAVAIAKASPDKPSTEALEKAIAEWKAKK